MYCGGGREEMREEGSRGKRSRERGVSGENGGKEILARLREVYLECKRDEGGQKRGKRK